MYANACERKYYNKFKNDLTFFSQAMLVWWFGNTFCACLYYPVCKFINKWWWCIVSNFNFCVGHIRWKFRGSSRPTGCVGWGIATFTLSDNYVRFAFFRTGKANLKRKIKISLYEICDLLLVTWGGKFAFTDTVFDNSLFTKLNWLFIGLNRSCNFFSLTFGDGFFFSNFSTLCI